MYCYHGYGEAPWLFLRSLGSKNTTGCGDYSVFCFVFFLLTYETDQIDFSVPKG